MAAPSFVNVGVVNGNGTATVTPALPGSLVTNNALISICTANATGKTITTATTGWTVGGQSSAGSQSGAWAYCLQAVGRVAPVWTWTGNATNQAIVSQWTGNATSSYIGNINSAHGDSSTSATMASITSTADNSLIIPMFASNSTTAFVVGPDFTQASTTGNSQGSILIMDGVLPTSGTASDALTVTVGTSANWVSFGIELKGSGSTTGRHQRATQVVQEVLENYSSTNNQRVTQVVQEVLENYVGSNNQIVTQVVLQVLRSQAANSTPVPKSRGLIIH